MRAALIVTGESRVRWSAFGEGGVVGTSEFLLEDLNRAALACEWMASFTLRAAAEGAATLEDANEWTIVGDRFRALQSGLRPGNEGSVASELRG